MANKDYQNVPVTTVVRDMTKLEEKTGNVYESIAIISKRANQISAQMKEELHNKLQEFSNDNDTLEEVFENREQIEISKHYERMPKATAIATQELLDDKIYMRKPEEQA
jgi:DNA-directed RNA polymerase subunit K/omega